MKVTMLNTAYLAEDGYVFACGNLNDFAKVLRAVGTSGSSKEAAEILTERGIPYKLYKEVPDAADAEKEGLILSLMKHATTEYDLPVYRRKRNKQLREYCLKNCISHRRIAELIGKDEDSIQKWKNRIGRYCSITHPQKITDEAWDAIQAALESLEDQHQL